MTQLLINIGSAPNDGTGDQLRTSFDKCNLNFTELYSRSASVSGFAEYKFDTTTTPPPASGYIRANNASVAAVTVLYFNNVTNNGSDIKRVLTEMPVGTVMIIQDQDNNVNFGKFTVTATPIDQTSYVQFPVSCSDSGGTLFNNARVLVAVMGGGGGGGGAPTSAEYLTKSADATLTAERVITDATAITWDWTTAGQVKAIRAALTGDVTAAADGVATTIANGAVTNAKHANSPASTIKGNNTVSAAAPIDLTGTQTTAMLDVFTSALKGLAPPSGGGTANFLRADATWAAPAGGGGGTTQVKVQTFTASGSYVPSANLISAVVECVGGGGGGGGIASSSNQGQGGGGGAGGYSRKYLTAAQIGASQTITIGSFGAGGAAGNNNGVAGLDTSFGTLCIGKGGSGGGGQSANSAGNGGAGGIAGTGDITGTGEPGFGGTAGGSIATAVASPAGGSSAYGGGGAAFGGNISGPGNAATGYGSGGGGGNCFAGGAAQAGGNGSAGICIVTEYIGIVPSGGGNVPTYQTFTSGSGTYTTPIGVRQIEVTLIGGGAGGGGGGGGGVGTAGGNTTFGASWAANGGSVNLAYYQSGPGGTVTAGAGTIESVIGARGQDGIGAGATESAGGQGGATPYGGAGGGGNGRAGAIASANTGSGGGGGGSGTSASGAGGAAGGYLRVIINTPAATYAYAIGAAGSGGSVGSGGSPGAGGNGAAGIIIVREIY